ncbi:putative acyl-CoA-binding protein like protein [Tothia fuscella]|uniref:Acyl-CoA-binding protein like protein n=1 Tax=Tothia fuscella TaxID=1048955 RepID=A0A9P4U1I7_9PEZI|nr:putative acyl-CoA-binding protein like protein [Tothia fuscella]
MTAFDDAYKNAKNLAGAGQADQLELYGYAKIAKGEDISKAPKPGMFDIAGKTKRNKWQEFIDAGVTKDQAQKKYVEKFNDLKTKHGLKA